MKVNISRKATALALASGILASMAGVATNAFGADDGATASFRYTAHDSCVAGSPGTFVPGGDVTNYYGTSTAMGTGVITFDFVKKTVTDTNIWSYQVPPGPIPQINGLPLGIFPQPSVPI